MRNLVSVVVPAYNAARFILTTLRAVQCQTHSKFEVIVIDDGSTDDTARLVQAFCDTDPRFNIIMRENGGVSAARNFGAALSSGQIIAFLDADDIWYPEFLAKTVDFMETRADVSVCFAGVRIVDEMGHPTGAFASRKVLKPTITDFLAGNPTTTCSNLMVRRRAFVESGGFREGLNHAEDQLWLIELQLKGKIIEGIDSILLDYRTNQAGLSADTKAMAAGWDAMAKLASKMNPTKVLPHLPAARAANRLYLAHRAIRTRKGLKVAFSHGLEAAASHWPTIFHECMRILRKRKYKVSTGRT
jgi:glycosyltransferase involved in cell wall biosynthesis